MIGSLSILGGLFFLVLGLCYMVYKLKEEDRKCENCGNNREEYLNHYCKSCLDKMTDDSNLTERVQD
jgi:hypothetical protein